MGDAQKHLVDFQIIDNSLTADDVARILEFVRQTGVSTPAPSGRKLYEAKVELGTKQVTVQVVESSAGNIKTGYPKGS
ncbi:MAG TPA: hypothetical protein VGZ22_10945 [Isosphaeraceae bacterium]|jgi:hypothetical protein|nr:hypothetical protein [Isosphaeraceae bacterium]